MEAELRDTKVVSTLVWLLISLKQGFLPCGSISVVTGKVKAGKKT